MRGVKTDDSYEDGGFKNDDSYEDGDPKGPYPCVCWHF